MKMANRPLSENARRESVCRAVPVTRCAEARDQSLGVLILVALRGGTHRFSELRRKMGGVSEKMLAQSLQALEQDGFINRVSRPVVPPHVGIA